MSDQQVEQEAPPHPTDVDEPLSDETYDDPVEAGVLLPSEEDFEVMAGEPHTYRREWDAHVVISHRRGRYGNDERALPNLLNQLERDGWTIFNIYPTKPGAWRVVCYRMANEGSKPEPLSSFRTY